MHLNFNLRFLSHKLTVFDSIKCCTIYTSCSTITIQWFWEWRKSIPNLLEEQYAIPCVLRLDLLKQMEQSVVEDAWSVRFSSTMLGSSRITNCHWRTLLLQLRLWAFLIQEPANRNSTTSMDDEFTKNSCNTWRIVDEFLKKRMKAQSEKVREWWKFFLRFSVEMMNCD